LLDIKGKLTLVFINQIKPIYKRNTNIEVGGETIIITIGKFSREIVRWLSGK
jgi:hypothetical protein